MKLTVREAEHTDPERGYSFRVKTRVNFGVIVDMECISQIPGIFDDICNNFKAFLHGRPAQEAYFLGPDAFRKNVGPFKSETETRACEILFDLLRQTLSGVYEK